MKLTENMSSKRARPTCNLIRRCGFIVAAGLSITACVAIEDRSPVPQAQQNLVRLEDLTLVRFWGDEVTPEIQAVIRKQYRQVLDAAHAGERRASPRRADYLAISGGGANGAFAAGVLTGWTKRGDRPAFEVVTGVSTGALAAPFAFLGPRYDAELKEVYTA